jgi:hypothetical protein
LIPANLSYCADVSFVRAQLAVLASLCAIACGDSTRLDRPAPAPAARLTGPTRLCVVSAQLPSCRSADEVERWLADPDLEIVGAALPPTGIQGARVLTLRTAGPEPIVFRAKWRAYATSSSKNSPRRELGAYQVQKLFLDPDQFVVPPTAPHCFGLDAYRARVDGRAAATFREFPCVYGVLSYWLEEVQTLPDAGRAGWFHWSGGALDVDLFAANPIYRDAVANLNLVTYLIGHADSHWKQFLIAKDPRVPVVYVVDNSMSFGAKKNTRVKQDWSQIRVPSLPSSSIERLRRAGPAVDALLSVADLEQQGDSMVRARTSVSSGRFSGEAAWADGRIRIGLRPDEVAGLRARLAALLDRIDKGDLRVHR